MKLLKVHVHNYRHLKDVSLTFEPDLYPQVFAIGSENGGGKSTLLQLVFTLLHCAPHSNLHKFVINAIQHMKSSLENLEDKIHQIIDIELMDKNEIILISYLLYPAGSQDEENIENLSIGGAVDLIALAKSLKNKINSLNLDKNENLRQLNLAKYAVLRSSRSTNDAEDRARKIEATLQRIDKLIRVAQEELENIPEKVCSQVLREANLKFICSIDINSGNSEVSHFNLCCTINHHSSIESHNLLGNLSKQIFLAGQTTQPYIFLSNENIGDMINSDKSYEMTLEKARLEIGNLYNFNAFAVNEIIAAFKAALEEDAKSMIQNGYYSSSFSDLTKELKFILGGNKEILPTPECDGLTIRYYIDDKNYKELSLGELSHGELKRVCLYSWIRHNKASQSIVLIDEIENGLHPDWQYQIVKDLQEWGDNQYILATHSFYLCEALTPRHVKELAPKMSQPILNK
jgi:energy-coupling factor transporter ATP-binding protein EcfA2